MQPGHAVVLEAREMLLRAALRGDQDRHALFDHDVEVGGGARIVERHVDGERPVGAVLHGPDRGAQRVRIHRAGGDHAERAGLRDRERQLGVGRRPAHAGLDDRIPDAEQRR